MFQHVMGHHSILISEAKGEHTYTVPNKRYANEKIPNCMLSMFCINTLNFSLTLHQMR
jgi:hypothetical protein